jgi:hypothetical protein
VDLLLAIPCAVAVDFFKKITTFMAKFIGQPIHANPLASDTFSWGYLKNRGFQTCSAD